MQTLSSFFASSPGFVCKAPMEWGAGTRAPVVMVIEIRQIPQQEVWEVVGILQWVMVKMGNLIQGVVGQEEEQVNMLVDGQEETVVQV